ncbi:MAG: hypothetical protein R3277_08985 [Brumimicrobium sp.]|nr:hypothetical protein [Brumimicrobium sp.]
MENLDANTTVAEISVSATAKNELIAASGWAKAMAIIGIIFSGFGILAGLLALFGIPILGIIYLVTYGIFIYLWIILLNQANNITAGNFNLDKFAAYYGKFWKLSVIILIISVVLGIIAGIMLVSTGNQLFR